MLSLASSISASLVRDLFSLLLPELPDVSVFRRFRFLPVFFLQVDPVVVSSRRNGDIVLKCDIGNKVTNEPTAVYVEFDCLAVDQCGNCEEFRTLVFFVERVEWLFCVIEWKLPGDQSSSPPRLSFYFLYVVYAILLYLQLFEKRPFSPALRTFLSPRADLLVIVNTFGEPS